MTNLPDEKDDFIILFTKHPNDIIENIKTIMQKILKLAKPLNFVLLINFFSLPITIYSLKRHLQKRR